MRLLFVFPALTLAGWFWGGGGEMPIARKIEQDGKLRYLPHLKFDSSGRVIEAYGRIPLHDDACQPGSRSNVPKATRDEVMKFAEMVDGRIVDDLGHIIPFSLCGADHVDNFFPQNALANRHMGRVQEAIMARGRRQGAFDYIDFHFRFEYDSKEKRPSRTNQHHEWGFRNGNHESFDVVVENPKLGNQDSGQILKFAEGTVNAAREEIMSMVEEKSFLGKAFEIVWSIVSWIFETVDSITEIFGTGFLAYMPVAMYQKYRSNERQEDFAIPITIGLIACRLLTSLNFWLGTVASLLWFGAKWLIIVAIFEDNQTRKFIREVEKKDSTAMEKITGVGTLWVLTRLAASFLGSIGVLLHSLVSLAVPIYAAYLCYTYWELITEYTVIKRLYVNGVMVSETRTTGRSKRKL